MRNNVILALIVPTLLLSQPREIEIPSSADGVRQSAVIYTPSKSKEPVPLVVALHSWSSNYKQTLNKPVQEFCVRNDWAYIHPDFRGPNRNPQATGSELAVQDVLDAVEYVKKNSPVDPSRVYLTGTSGGGYMSLLLAGRSPGTFAAVSAWVPISDLIVWYKDSSKRRNKYAREINQSCGGKPGSSSEVDLQYSLRSPNSWLHLARDVKIDINAGIRDGHIGSVPISHSINAFNILAHPQDRLTQAQIKFFDSKATIPPSLTTASKDQSYGNRQPIFRRSSGNARLTIFDGGHEMIPSALIKWLEDMKQNHVAD